MRGAGRGGREGEEGRTRFMHGRSRMAIDPHISAMPGRSTSCLHRPDRHRVHQTRRGRGGGAGYWSTPHADVNDGSVLQPVNNGGRAWEAYGRQTLWRRGWV